MQRTRIVQHSLCAPSCHVPDPTIGTSQTGTTTRRQSGSSPLPSKMKDGTVCCQLQDILIRQSDKTAARNSHGLLIPVQAGYGYGGAQGFASIRPVYTVLCLLSFQEGVLCQMHGANFPQVLGRHAGPFNACNMRPETRCRACCAGGQERAACIRADVELCLPGAATKEGQRAREGGILSSMALQHNHSRIQHGVDRSTGLSNREQWFPEPTLAVLERC